MALIKKYKGPSIELGHMEGKFKHLINILGITDLKKKKSKTKRSPDEIE
jgi:hypothetical protein